MTVRKEYGDFQTPPSLAHEVVSLITKKIGIPGNVVEPTCGIGNFIDAAHRAWGDDIVYRGFEINPTYCAAAQSRFTDNKRIRIEPRDFFSTEWQNSLGQSSDKITLVIGNPPWVTNATLGSLNSSNLPNKSNFQGLRGFEAKTGKANFDIAEWMIIRLVEALPVNGVLAMLCKTSTARKILFYFWQVGFAISDEELYRFDAKKYFNVSVDACLLMLRKTEKLATTASIFDSLSDETPSSRFGLQHGEIIANLENYQKYKELDGFSNYKWRSGVKHDSANVMELIPCDSGYINGMGESVQIENDFVYPLLKSSDLGNGRVIPRRSVIITQTTVGDDTSRLRALAPRTYAYLEDHSGFLDFRKSSIYRKRPRFSIFGIGGYSFAKWKVGISGLYKELRFTVVPPVNEKPTMLDDTCYFFPCVAEEEACFWATLLNTEDSLNFLHSLVFFDAKRPVNIDILNRIDLAQLARRQGVFTQAEKYLQLAGAMEGKNQQMLVFEEPEKYQINNPLTIAVKSPNGSKVLTCLNTVEKKRKNSLIK